MTKNGIHESAGRTFALGASDMNDIERIEVFSLAHIQNYSAEL